MPPKRSSVVIRASKYRHIFGKVNKSDQIWSPIKFTRTSWDATNYVAVSTKFVAMLWDSIGGGAFWVAPIDKPGRLPATPPLVSGHQGAVYDLAANPFNPHIFASAADDTTVKLWKIPEGGLKETMTESVQTLQGHERKAGTVAFHPCANNVLLSSGADHVVNAWDVEKGQQIVSWEASEDIIMSTSFDYTGANIAVGGKDKMLRLFDIRAQKETASVQAHTGAKGFRTVWLGKKNRVATLGFSRSSDRQLSVWDPRKLKEPLSGLNLDTGSGILMPHFDEDTGVLYLAGKGDGNIRYYEMIDEDPYWFYLSSFSGSPSKGVGWAPKRALNIMGCEVARAYRATSKALEPTSFTVPRKSPNFQADIFPDTHAGKPALDAKAWAAGENKDPVKVNLKGYKLDGDDAGAASDFTASKASSSGKGRRRSSSSKKAAKRGLAEFNMNPTSLFEAKKVIQAMGKRIEELEG